MTYKVIKIGRDDGIYKTSTMPSFFTDGNITIKQIFPIPDAAATCSDLPYTVADYVDTVTVKRCTTSNNETNTAEYLEDSGDEGVLNF